MQLNINRLERISKGFASRRRLQALEVMYYSPNLTVGQVAQIIKTDQKNASEHIQRMAAAGLVSKRIVANERRLTLTKLGIYIYQELRKIPKSL